MVNANNNVRIPTTEYKPGVKRIIAETEDCKSFLQVYEEKKPIIKNYFCEISQGSDINIDCLHEIIVDIFKEVKCKNDIVTFISSTQGLNEHTCTHSCNVAILCKLFGNWLNMAEDDIKILTVAGLLHDIGKTYISDEILNKQTRLTNEEFEIVKNHTVYGYDILKKHDIPIEIKNAALMHHEKMDGKGYPLGIHGKEIDSIARIVSICDIYDAMTSNRIYRAKISPFEVIRTFETSVYGELDPSYLVIFMRSVAYTYIGSWVTLTDESNAEIVIINNDILSRPLVRISDNEFKDMSRCNDIYIKNIL